MGASPRSGIFVHYVCGRRPHFFPPHSLAHTSLFFVTLALGTQEHHGVLGGNALLIKPRWVSISCPSGARIKMASCQAAGLSLLSTLSPYSAPIASSGGSCTTCSPATSLAVSIAFVQ